MKIEGNAVCIDMSGRQYTVEGEGNFPDDTPLKSLKVKGEFFFGKISCDTLKIEGNCTGESLKTKNFSVEGTLEADSTNVTEILNIEGSLKVADVEATEIFIKSRSGSVGKIKCRNLKIFHNETSCRPSRSRLQIKSIDADILHAENCVVDVIKCRDAFIGTNCIIEKLFVAGECKIVDNSTVGEIIQI